MEMNQVQSRALRSRTVLLLSGFTAMAVVIVGTAAGATQLRTIGKASASGDYAIALASGQAKRPAAIYARITSRPPQSVSGHWTMVCGKGFGAGSKSGSFKGRSPVQRRLRMPMSRPDNCTVSASGSLDRSGRIVVTLLKN
jgi:hypothetical protein